MHVDIMYLNEIHFSNIRRKYMSALAGIFLAIGIMSMAMIGFIIACESIGKDASKTIDIR